MGSISFTNIFKPIIGQFFIFIEKAKQGWHW